MAELEEEDKYIYTRKKARGIWFGKGRVSASFHMSATFSIFCKKWKGVS